MVALRHTIVTGQSLANGYSGVGGVASPSTQANTQLHRVLSSGALGPLEFTGSNFPTQQMPERTLGEKAWQTGDSDSTTNTHALNGTAYVGLKKGTATYNAAIARAQIGYTAAIARGDTFVFEALHTIHGENDHAVLTPRATYLADLKEWLADYTADIKAITGQTSNPFSVLSQLGSDVVNDIALAQLDAHRQHNGITMACPRYWLHVPGALHLIPKAYYFLGELHGKVHRILAGGGTWNPLMPLSYVKRGTALVVTFAVPTPPLVFDTTTVAAQTAKGFAVTDAAGAVTINTATISGSTVVLGLARATAAPITVTYGSTGFGNLRDSDPMVSAYDATALQNWCVMFSEASEASGATAVRTADGVSASVRTSPSVVADIWIS